MSEARYLWPEDYMADPSAHVFNGKITIYPSHDRESGIPERDNGDHFDMKDYHAFTMGFPFECITDAAMRRAIMQGILSYLIPN